MTYDVREMEPGKCGRCEAPVKPQYLWCDDCEDLVVRVNPTSLFWVDRKDLKQESQNED